MNPKEYIVTIIKDAIAKHLPNVKPEDLEERGKVYYMNDQNGTIFDWTMNKHASAFMCFYNDGMGAAKALVYDDGAVNVYLYEPEAPHKNMAEEKASMDATDVLALATFMYFNADAENRFGKSLDDLEYAEPSEEKIAEFQKLCEESENE